MTKPQTQESLLKPALNLRTVTWADVHSVAKLIYDVCEADGDTTVAATPEELEHQWRTEALNPERDTWLIETKGGQVVGYGEFVNIKDHAHLGTDIYVHPQFKGRGLIDLLLQEVEGRAREEIELAEPDLRVFIHSTMDGKDEEGKKAHEVGGFVPVRFHWRMEIKLDAPPPVPAWPDGIELRPFIKEDHAIILWQAETESFSEHWGSHGSTFEKWSFRKLGRPEFDPNLWFVVWDGDQIAGFSQNRYRSGIGWVGTLGVRSPWRKKGLGLALLQYSFGEFYKRGMKTIGLGVDASNSTGATRLYQNAGMYVASEFVTFEKELRSGKSLEE